MMSKKKKGGAAGGRGALKWAIVERVQLMEIKQA